ncbi:MAG: chitobiase/beta-hexosaminidase C-terminal domain-containing protein, partial [Planctomycetota bacterium]
MKKASLLALLLLAAGADERRAPLMPEFSHAGGFVKLPIELTIICKTPGAEIRYSTDGSDPGPGSAVYRAPIRITKAGCVRARAYMKEEPPSRIRSATFLAGERPSLPLLCVTTDPDNLHNPRTGIIRNA